MNRVLDRLWLGGTNDVLPGSTLRAMGFFALVDLRDRVGPGDGVPDGIEVLAIRNKDGEPWTGKQMQSAFDFIHRNIQKGRVLVVCVAGMSRSASTVIGYLHRCGWDVPEAFKRTREARPEISPSPGMLEAALRSAIAVPRKKRP